LASNEDLDVEEMQAIYLKLKEENDILKKREKELLEELEMYKC
jgi:hypothetical protein